MRAHIPVSYTHLGLDGADNGSTKGSGQHAHIGDAEVGAVILGTEAIGRDGGGHSGHAAIGEADEQQAGHRRNGPAAAQREEQQQAGKDEAADIGEHGEGVALFIKQEMCIRDSPCTLP